MQSDRMPRFARASRPNIAFRFGTPCSLSFEVAAPRRTTTGIIVGAEAVREQLAILDARDLQSIENTYVRAEDCRCSRVFQTGPLVTARRAAEILREHAGTHPEDAKAALKAVWEMAEHAAARKA